MIKFHVVYIVSYHVYVIYLNSLCHHLFVIMTWGSHNHQRWNCLINFTRHITRWDDGLKVSFSLRCKNRIKYKQVVNGHHKEHLTMPVDLLLNSETLLVQWYQDIHLLRGPDTTWKKLFVIGPIFMKLHRHM